MKKFLAVAAILAVTSVYADETSFGDLNYFFKQGQLNLASDLISSHEVTHVNDADTEAEGYVSSTKVTFGLMDNVNLFVELNALYKYDTDSTGASVATATGLQNPVLGASIRLMNQGTSGFNFDVGAVADLNIMDYETSEGGKTNGNSVDPFLSEYGDPRSSLVVNARLGKKWNEANEFYLVTALAYNKDGEYEDKEADEDVDLDSSLDFSLGAFYQYRPVHEFMMTLGLNGTRFGEMDGEEANNDFTVSDHIDLTFSFTAKYLITDNFIAKFHFSQDRRSDFDAEYDGAVADTDYERRTANKFGVGVDFLF